MEKENYNLKLKLLLINIIKIRYIVCNYDNILFVK